MMKKIVYLSIFIFSLFLVCTIDVQAAQLLKKNITLECIYGDGGIYTSTHNDSCEGENAEEENEDCKNAAGDNIKKYMMSYSVDRADYKLYGAPKSERIRGEVSYLNDIATQMDLSEAISSIAGGSKYYPRCQDIAIHSWFDSDEDHVEERVVYFFGNKALEFLKEAKNGGYKRDAFFLRPNDASLYLAYIIWNYVYTDFSKSDGGDGVSGWTAYQDSIEILKNYRTYPLISERYILNSDAPAPNAKIYYKRIKDENKTNNSQEAKEITQAAEVEDYATIWVYDNVVLLERNSRITPLDGDLSKYLGVTRPDPNSTELSKEVPETIYLNSPEPFTSTNTSSTMAYRFLPNQKRYSYKESEDTDHTNKYEITDEIPDANKKRSDALCNEILPETSKVLRNVIKGAQIIIPVLLIVLTGLDIGKIVLTGNIEEELPKRKKLIMARFIVAIVFFFLPLFVSLVIDWLKDSGAKNADAIEYIDCLFK